MFSESKAFFLIFFITPPNRLIFAGNFLSAAGKTHSHTPKNPPPLSAHLPKKAFQPFSRQTRLVRVCPVRASLICHPPEPPIPSKKALNHLAAKHALCVFAPLGQSSFASRTSPLNSQPPLAPAFLLTFSQPILSNHLSTKCRKAFAPALRGIPSPQTYDFPTHPTRTTAALPSTQKAPTPRTAAALRHHSPSKTAAALRHHSPSKTAARSPPSFPVQNRPHIPRTPLHLPVIYHSLYSKIYVFPLPKYM